MTEAEYFQKLNKKNKTSAVLFLTGAGAVLIVTLLVVFVFMLLFGILQAIFSGAIGSRAAGVSVSSVLLDITSQFWVLFIFSAVAIVAQIIAGAAMLKKRSWARTAGIVAFSITLITFMPVALILIYPFVFLLGNDGKYLYKTLIKK